MKACSWINDVRFISRQEKYVYAILDHRDRERRSPATPQITRRYIFSASGSGFSGAVCASKERGGKWVILFFDQDKIEDSVG